MFKVGDYVVDKDYESAFNEIVLLQITGISESVWCKEVMQPDEVHHLCIEQLRPAVLSDWAKEIPEKYRNECADDERYIWLISYPNNEVGIVLSANNNSNQCYLVDEKWFIADALSAYYGIPILPYEQYKEYMKELKKGE